MIKALKELWPLICVVVVVLFVLVTFLAGIHGRDVAADVVNAGCAPHGGVRSWGGPDTYSATCEDGYAFTGDKGNGWGWPW